MSMYRPNDARYFSPGNNSRVVPGISLVPNEILGEIFALCASLALSSPRTLCAVSCAWRRVASTTPRVWTRLHIPIGRESHARMLSDIMVWGALSGACPLTVDVEIASPGVHTDAVMAVAQCLISYLPRVRSLSLRATSEAQSLAFLSALFSNAQEVPCGVQSIELTISSTAHKHTDLRAQAIALPPSVTHLKVENMEFSASWLRLSRLTSLEIIRSLRFPPISISTILDILAASPHIESFTFEGRILEAPSASALLRTLSLPSLHTLHLTSNNIHGALLSLRLPRLHTLHLTDWDGLAPWTGAALKQLTAHTPPPPLRALRLDRCAGLPSADAVHALHRLPHLARLQLVGGSAQGDAVPRALCAPAVCPRLREVAVEQCPAVHPTALARLRAARPDVTCTLVGVDAGARTRPGWIGGFSLGSERGLAYCVKSL